MQAKREQLQALTNLWPKLIRVSEAGRVCSREIWKWHEFIGQSVPAKPIYVQGLVTKALDDEAPVRLPLDNKKAELPAEDVPIHGAALLHQPLDNKEAVLPVEDVPSHEAACS